MGNLKVLKTNKIAYSNCLDSFKPISNYEFIFMLYQSTNINSLKRSIRMAQRSRLVNIDQYIIIRNLQRIKSDIQKTINSTERSRLIKLLFSIILDEEFQSILKKST